VDIFISYKYGVELPFVLRKRVMWTGKLSMIEGMILIRAN